jgi:hypothetical protein
MSPISTDNGGAFPSRWVQNVLSTELRFRDGDPVWSKASNQTQAIAKRLEAVRFLSKHASVRPEINEITERLRFCSPHDRCCSAACPECGRAIQRFAVLEFQKLLRTGRFCVASIIDAKMSIRADLTTVSLRGLVNRTRSILRRNGVALAAGGVDFSFNEHENGRFEPHWCAHLWFLLPTENRQKWEVGLRDANPASAEAPRPVKIQKWDGRSEALAYALKSEFKRRVTVHANGRRNTSEQDLRVAERLALYQYLNSIGLDQRVFLLGVRPTMTDLGISLVKLRLRNQ